MVYPSPITTACAACIFVFFHYLLQQIVQLNLLTSQIYMLILLLFLIHNFPPILPIFKYIIAFMSKIVNIFIYFSSINNISTSWSHFSKMFNLCCRFPYFKYIFKSSFINNYYCYRNTC